MEVIVARNAPHIPAEELVELLGSHSEEGLDRFEVEARQQRIGPNILSERRGDGPLKCLLLQFHQPLIYVLLAATGVTSALGEWLDAGVIFGVVVVNVVIGFVQESRAADAVRALSRTLETKATVVRGGKRIEVASSELVPGDVVLLQSGDRVPADLRLLRQRDLQVDESALTGESVPVEKATNVLDDSTPLAERQNMAYASTLVTHGTSRGLVVATADNTEIGQISELIASTDVLATPLTQRIEQFTIVLLVAILAMATLTFAIGLARGGNWFDMFMAAVALAVGAIPEGLPAAVTIMLALGVSRMAKRRVIVRRLPAVEALGSTTVICSDKTGTLTQNEMTVQAIETSSRRYSVSGSGYEREGAIEAEAPHSESDTALVACLRAGVLCNDADLVSDDGRWVVRGDPTEAALIISAAKGSLERAELEGELPRVDVVPFESQQQYMATLHAPAAGADTIAFVKGSAERLLARCGMALGASGEPVSLDAEHILRAVDGLAARGLRVLAFAEKRFPEAKRQLDHADLEDGLVFLGLQAMMDPPRPEALEAVRLCREAGIGVKMITGDHAATALAIAARLGIGAPDQKPVTGPMLESTTDEALIDLAERTHVFARVSPEHKLRIVRALQARGHVVAMTGDGVNDAPALRRADIGVAMALGGTEVAREASDVVLTDDNFASIRAAIEEGRGIFDNLIKFIVWTLPTNGGEALVILLAVGLGLSLPILPLQILWINMTTAVLLGLMLAFEVREPGIMQRPPRDPGTSILNGALLGRIVYVSLLLCAGAFGLFEWTLIRGGSEAEARTAAVGIFVVGEAFYLLNCRSLTRSMFSVGLFSNPWLWGGIASMAILQLAFTYAPFMQRAFGSATIDGLTWLAILGFGFVLYAAVGTEKWLRRRATLTGTHEREAA